MLVWSRFGFKHGPVSGDVLIPKQLRFWSRFGSIAAPFQEMFGFENCSVLEPFWSRNCSGSGVGLGRKRLRFGGVLVQNGSVSGAGFGMKRRCNWSRFGYRILSVWLTLHECIN